MAEMFGLQVEDLPESWHPLDVIAVVKCADLGSDETGPAGARLSTRTSGGLNVWEALGMLEAAAADLRQQYLAALEEG